MVLFLKFTTPCRKDWKGLNMNVGDQFDIEKSLNQFLNGIDRWRYLKLEVAWRWLEVDRFKKNLRGRHVWWALMTGYGV